MTEHIEVTFIDRPDLALTSLGRRFDRTPSTGSIAVMGNPACRTIGARFSDLPNTQDKVTAILG